MRCLKSSWVIEFSWLVLTSKYDIDIENYTAYRQMSFCIQAPLLPSSGVLAKFWNIRDLFTGKFKTSDSIFTHDCLKH